MLTEDNPLPAVMGRVCYHPCEGACNRAQFDEAVSIHAVERFLGDHAIREKLAFRVDAPSPAASACWSSVPARAAFLPPII